MLGNKLYKMVLFILFIGFTFGYSSKIVSQSLSNLRIIPSYQFIIDNNLKDVADAGDVIEYKIQFFNCSSVDIEGLRYYVILDTNTTLIDYEIRNINYEVATKCDNTPSRVEISLEPPSSIIFKPLDVIIPQIPSGQELSFTYRVEVNRNLPDTIEFAKNELNIILNNERIYVVDNSVRFPRGALTTNTPLTQQEILATVTALPATGEIPWWRDLLIVVSVVLAVIAIWVTIVSIKKHRFFKR